VAKRPDAHASGSVPTIRCEDDRSEKWWARRQGRLCPPYGLPTFSSIERSKRAVTGLDFWAPLAYSVSVRAPLITVAETPLFQRQAKDVWDEDEREAFVNFIARNPEAGDVIADTGGVRKVRWGRGSSGKRGGTRVIYFYHDANLPLYLLMVYAKARQEDLSADEKRAVRKLVGILKS
jgi:hypothetical protein